MKIGENLLKDLDRRIGLLEAQGEVDRAIPNPIEWSEDVSKTKLDVWQADFITSPNEDTLFNCARQTGKSQSVSLKTAFRTKWLKRWVAVLAPTLRQSSVIYRRSRLWLIRDNTEFARATAHELEVVNGGTFAALPGDRPDLSIRGDTIDDLVVDEASRIKDTLIAAATPATATRNSTITYLTTPAGKQGVFWEAWDKQDWWRKIKVKAVDCPRIKPEFLEREKKRLGALYAQEYECEFLDSPGGLFISADLDRIFSMKHHDGIESGILLPQREPIWDEFRSQKAA